MEGVIYWFYLVDKPIISYSVLALFGFLFSNVLASSCTSGTERPIWLERVHPLNPL